MNKEGRRCCGRSTAVLGGRERHLTGWRPSRLARELSTCFRFGLTADIRPVANRLRLCLKNALPRRHDWGSRLHQVIWRCVRELYETPSDSSSTFLTMRAKSFLTTGFIKNPFMPRALALSSVSFSLNPVQMIMGIPDLIESNCRAS